jgi:hypothetical protein
MLPKRAPPLMRPVMKMVSNQVLDAMINPQLKLPAYLSLQISGKIPLDLPIPIRSLADAVLADERVRFASTSPAAAIRRLPQRAMSST